MIFLTIMLPFLNTLFFNIAIGRNPRGLSIAVVNDEISMFNCTEAMYSTCFLDDNSTVTLSCLFINLLRNKSYTVVSTSADALKNFIRFYFVSVVSRLTVIMLCV